MRETKAEAKTIQDAVEKGLAEMGLRRDQVEVVVVTEGTTGFLGFGAKKACVILTEKRWADGRGEETRERGGRGGGRGGRGGGRDGRGPRRDGRGGGGRDSGSRSSAPARRPGRYGYEDARLPPPQQAAEAPRGERPRRDMDRSMERSRDRVYNEEPLAAGFLAIEQIADPVEHAKTALLKMTSLMGMEATVTEARMEAGENLLFIRFDCPNSAAFTEDNGRGLQALQFVLNSIVSRRREPHLALRLDTGGYWDSKEKELERMVSDAVNSVKASGTPCRLEPMPASMRKMVHNIVKASHPGVETSSEGEGRWRKVSIRLAANAQAQQAAAPAAETAQAHVAAPAPVMEAAPVPAAAQPAQEETKAPATDDCCCGGSSCCGGDKAPAEKPAEEQPAEQK
ncbi:MAG TPA: Jag N-terminal domain-containing protein [Elusimicrobiales bacterium]|nr:Jag N-terminal domain-containing protein [Elusimicrobiales bacterium]